MNKLENLKSKFPFFVNNPGITYLDSAATTHKPNSVIKTINDYYCKNNANAGRGIYSQSLKLENDVEDVREKVANFINAKIDNIIFTSGATSGIEQISNLLLPLFNDGDEIIFSPFDHKSLIQPWHRTQQVARNFGQVIKLVPYSYKESGEANLPEIRNFVSNKTRIIATTHLHNIYGEITDVAQLKGHTQDALVCLDATQSVSHGILDVEDLGADITVFSGHKMFASQGVGVIALSDRAKAVLSRSARILGSETLRSNLESGTQNWAGILSLKPAIEFIEELGSNNIHKHLAYLTQLIVQGLRNFKKVEFTKGPANWRCADGYGIVSFNVAGLEPSELGFILNEQNICVRSGDHCNFNKKEQSVRVSLQVYNDEEDIQRFLNVLTKLLHHRN